jgi:lysophospholipase L1-like esterase
MIAVSGVLVASALVQAAAAPSVTEGAGSPGLALGGPPQGNGGVLVVGDSLEVLTSPYLRRYLPGIPLTVNAEGGYNSYQLFDLFQESYDPSQSVIVFDAGTNDNPSYPQILAGNLDKVAAMIGSRCMVVPTIHGLTVNGVNSDGKNQVVHEFAASRPGTKVPDWARVATTHPELMQADDLHPTAEGADERARIIAAAVRACLNPSFATAPPPGRPDRGAENVPEPPKPVSGGHRVAAEVMRRVDVVMQAQVRIVRKLIES